MIKLYWLVDGKKYGKYKRIHFTSQKEAMNFYNKIKVERGWDGLGVSKLMSDADWKIGKWY